MKIIFKIVALISILFLVGCSYVSYHIDQEYTAVDASSVKVNLDSSKKINASNCKYQGYVEVDTDAVVEGYGNGITEDLDPHTVEQQTSHVLLKQKLQNIVAGIGGNLVTNTERLSNNYIKADVYHC